MSERFNQLNSQHAHLRTQCAAQRERLGETADDIERRLASVDRGVKVARGLMRRPVLIVGAVALIALKTASSVFVVTRTPVLPRKFVSLYWVIPAPSKTWENAVWRLASTVPNEGPLASGPLRGPLAGSSIRVLWLFM